MRQKYLRAVADVAKAAVKCPGKYFAENTRYFSTCCFLVIVAKNTMSPAVPVKCVHPYSGLLVILSCENVFHDAQLSRDLKHIRQKSDPTTKIK